MRVNKCEKLVCNVNYKKKYLVHIRTLNKTLYHRLVSQKVHRVNKFSENACF